MLDLPKNPLVSAYRASGILGLARNAVTKWKTQPGSILKPRECGKFHLCDVAKYLLERDDRGGVNVELKKKAKQIMKFYNGDTKPNKKKTENPQDKIESELPKGEGIEAALKRVQATEFVLAKKVEEAFLDPSDLTVTINNWNKILEILRKTEVDCLKVAEEKRDLIRFSHASEAYEKGILPVKQRLLSLPVQLSSLLENQQASMIQKIMEKEIDKVLKDIANIWDRDDNS